jgi:hypothetical protein
VFGVFKDMELRENIYSGMCYIKKQTYWINPKFSDIGLAIHTKEQ